MKKNAIKRVSEIAQNKESAAAKQLAERLNAQKHEEHKRDQIEGYRVQYEDQLNRMSETGVNSRTLSDYRKFLGNLDDVISQQRSVVKQASKNTDQSRSEWLKKYHRRSALEQLVDVQQKQHQAQTEKREQKIVDEISMQRGLFR